MECSPQRSVKKYQSGNSKTESIRDGMATSNLSAKCPQGVAVATILIHFESRTRWLRKETMRHATKSTESHRKISVKKSVEFELDHREPSQTVDDGGGDNQHIDVLWAETSSQHGSPARVAGADGRPNLVCRGPTRGPSSSDSMDVSTPAPPNEVLRKAREIWRP